jgi:primosomal protein N' (replication factor Y)
MATVSRIYQVAVPTPLYRLFDYLSTVSLAAGERVRVPFGKRDLVGIVLGEVKQSELPLSRLKTVAQSLDTDSLLPAPLLNLLVWAADYYHHPLGEVIHAALPVRLRQGRPASISGVTVWGLTPEGKALDPATLKRAPAQKHLFEVLAAAPEGLDAEHLVQVSPRWTAAIKAMSAKGWVSSHQRESPLISNKDIQGSPELNPGQKAAVAAVTAELGRFRPYLLHGVTGSGKTEVYLNVIEQVLALEKQTLVLVPEISLTPQLVDRFARRFRVPIAVLHSGLNDQERLNAWLAARAGKTPIVLGTRSAVFTPLKNPGLIVVDEEHDASYKQQDGFRYSARDVALMRASRERIPILLGSATPSLESLKKAREEAYSLLELPDRTGGAGMPDVRLLDICHHCGAEQAVVPRCPACQGANLHPLGEGTERVEGALRKFFPQARIERVDRDSTQRKGALEEKLRRVHEGEVDILVGTQMLSKGHDFPNVTLVGILNADQGLYGTDFRSGERLFQQIMQVSGRAGRADKPGEVLIQTWHPDHPLFVALQRHDFHGFADFALGERRDTGYPPYSHLALLRAESPAPGASLKFLHEARSLAQRLSPDKSVQILEPLPAPMERRAGRYRAQLLVQASGRAPLHAFLARWVADLAEAKFSKKVRWSLDVDPLDMY